MLKNKVKKESNIQNGFSCLHCHYFVPVNNKIGTHNRNHCPSCLWSLHLDEFTSGDRKSSCHELMKPVGLTFKKEGIDKYGKPKQGELMLVHECFGCSKISINRLAGDDNEEKILEVFEISKKLNRPLLKKLNELEINILNETNLLEIKKQLFGK